MNDSNPRPHAISFQLIDEIAERFQITRDGEGEWHLNEVLGQWHISHRSLASALRAAGTKLRAEKQLLRGRRAP